MKLADAGLRASEYLFGTSGDIEWDWGNPKGRRKARKLPPPPRKERRSLDEEITGLATGLYALQEDGTDGYIKIGITKNIQNRMRGYATHNPRQMVLLCYLEVPAGLEKIVHDLLKGHNVGGEWFSPAPEVLLLIEELKKRYDST